MAGPFDSALLRPLRAAPDRAAVLTDFDGTLAPIVDDPYGARPLEGAVDVLRHLADRYAVVAVISGRPVSFLLDRFGDPGSVILCGLYGLEWIEPGGVKREHPQAAAWRPVVATAADEADGEAPPGVIVERKGLSVVLHYRPAPQHEGWARAWAADAARRHGLDLHPGRMSIELRPPVKADKSTAVAELLGDVDAACFLGDDVGDLPAFDALDQLHTRRGARVVKLAVRSPEMPVALETRADGTVDGPAGALAVLRSLLD
jgi:trehalose 6-phosphate phosphatase